MSRRGCGCCGCVAKEQQLFPDFYSPDAICFKRYRERITVATLTTQTTETWVGGVQTNSTATIVDTDDVTDVTTDSVTQDMRAGQFEWVFPQVEIPFGPFVVESETGTPGTDGTRTYVPRTRIRTNRTVWEEYRLILKYDTSDQFNFGRDDALGADIIKAATARLGGSAYTIAGWTGFNSNTNAVDLRHAYVDFLDVPGDAAEYDTTWAAGLSSASYTATTVANVNVLPRLPTSDQEAFLLLFWSASAMRGRKIDGTGVLTIWDRTPITLPATPYDWQQDWIREDFQTWRTKRHLPTDNYQVSLKQFFGSTYWSRAGRELEISFVNDADEAVFFQNFFLDQTASGNPSSPVRWTVASTGSWGDVELNWSNSTALVIPTRLSTDFWVAFKIRGSVIEMGGGGLSQQTLGLVREEDGKSCRYQWVPLWHESIYEGDGHYGIVGLDRLYLRIRMISDNPQQGTYNETGLQHLVDGKKLTCPGNYTCSIIDDYAHPEFRVVSHSLASLNETGLEISAVHNSCSATLSSAVESSIITFEYTNYVYHRKRNLAGTFWRGFLHISDFPTVDTTGFAAFEAIVSVSPAFTGYTVSGLGPFVNLKRNVGTELLVASGIGEGLVLTVSSSTWDGTNQTSSTVIDRQHRIPTVSELPSGADLTSLQAGLGSMSYYLTLESDGIVYEITSTSIDPASVVDFVEQDIVDVTVVYSPIVVLVEPVDWENEQDEGPYPALDPESLSFVTRFAPATRLRLSESSGGGRPPLLEAVPEDSEPFPEYDAYEENNEFQFQLFTAKSRSWKFLKRVPRWRDNNVPTISFDESNIIDEWDETKKEFKDRIVRKVTAIGPADVQLKLGVASGGNLSFGQSNPWFFLQVERVEVDVSDLALTIGPSTYVPPDPV